MRKLLITSVLCGLAMSSYSQLKYFFPDSNAYFSVNWNKYWFQGDTVIENLKYKKVYVQSLDSIADFNKARYYEAVREDTIGGKIYCGPYLLYDFSVNVGDTVSYYSLWTGKSREVIKSIDSILIDGQYRRRINFIHYEGWSEEETESWIEGIGSTNGLFSPGYYNLSSGTAPKLLCVHVDGKIIYQTHDKCYIPRSLINIVENKNETFKIYPTIVNNFLYIETDENIEDFNYKIISIQGQIISGGILANIVNVSNLNKGFYFIVISDNKNIKYKVHKFVKL